MEGASLRSTRRGREEAGDLGLGHAGGPGECLPQRHAVVLVAVIEEHAVGVTMARPRGAADHGAVKVARARVLKPQGLHSCPRQEARRRRAQYGRHFARRLAVGHGRDVPRRVPHHLARRRAHGAGGLTRDVHKCVARAAPASGGGAAGTVSGGARLGVRCWHQQPASALPLGWKRRGWGMSVHEAGQVGEREAAVGTGGGTYQVERRRVGVVAAATMYRDAPHLNGWRCLHSSSSLSGVCSAAAREYLSGCVLPRSPGRGGRL